MLGVVDPITGLPTVTLIGVVEIQGMPLGFTIFGFNIEADRSATGALDLRNNSGAITIDNVIAKNVNENGVGILVTDQIGAVTLKNSKSNDNPGAGVFIKNLGASGITVTNSEINNNARVVVVNGALVNGLYLNTGGFITLDGVSVDGNGSLSGYR